MENRMRESLALWARLFVSQCAVASNSLVLDLGCGDGAFLREVVKTVRCAALGIDLRPSRPAPGVWMVRADVCRLPLRDAAVNAAFASNLLHHLPQPARCLAEVARVLVDGGGVCLRLASHAQIRAQLISRLFPEAAEAACARTPDLPIVIEMLRSAGLAVFAVEEVEEPATPTADELLERLRAGILPAPVTGQALEAAVRHLEAIVAEGGADAEPRAHLTLVAARKVALHRGPVTPPSAEPRAGKQGGQEARNPRVRTPSRLERVARLARSWLLPFLASCFHVPRRDFAYALPVPARRQGCTRLVAKRLSVPTSALPTHGGPAACSVRSRAAPI